MQGMSWESRFNGTVEWNNGTVEWWNSGTSQALPNCYNYTLCGESWR